MKNSKNKVIAATVCGVIVSSVAAAMFMNFDGEKEKVGAKSDKNDSVELVDNAENKNNENKDNNKEEIKNNENEVNEEVHNENDDNHQIESSDINNNSTEDSITDGNVNTVDGINTNTNTNTGSSNSGNSNNTINPSTPSGDNQSNVEKPSDGGVIEPDKEDEPAVEIPPVIPEPSLAYYDGSYTGTATGREAGLEVKVDIYLDQIARVTVVSHNETIGICDKALELIPYRITASQSTNVDIVSGATLTSNGIINAVNEALSKARR